MKIFIMPSIREITGSVVLEVMSRTLPAVTVKAFGALTIVDEECGWLYEGTSRDDCIENLKKYCKHALKTRKRRARKGKMLI